MKYLLAIVSIICIVGLSSCDRLDIEDGTPPCIKNLIADFDQEEKCETGVSVDKYAFQGNMVYVFNVGFCHTDAASSVFDADCNLIGYLGGFAGIYEVNGEDFGSADFVSTVWER